MIIGVALSFIPLVSVLMSVYNGEFFLSDALNSILNQSFSDFELILIDDGSTDKTAEIIHQFELLDKRIKVFRHEKNFGLTKSLSSGLAKCRGEFIARHDADDLSEPERFARQVVFLREYPEYGLIGTAVSRIDSQANIIDQPIVIDGARRIRSLIKGVNPFAHGSIMMRKSSVDAVNGYRSGFQYAQDYDLWLRISETTFVDNLLERLYRLRIHPAGISKQKLPIQIKYAALACLFANERHKEGHDSYTIMKKDFNGDIDAFFKLPKIKNEINRLIGRFSFCYGEREDAHQSFSQASGVSNILYRFICRRNWTFTLARETVRFLITQKSKYL
jgi:glycosyltransferase involved in cell wall biosynthesis